MSQVGSAPRHALAVAAIAALVVAVVLVRARARGPSPSASSSAAAPAPSSTAPAPAPSASDDVVRVELRTPRPEVARRAEAGLRAAAPGLLASCPAAAKGTHRFVVRASFDASGEMVTRDVVPGEGEPKGPLVACVEAALPRFRIDAPGSATHVDVELALP